MNLFVTITPGDAFIFTWSFPLENDVKDVEVKSKPFLAQIVDFLEVENKNWKDIQEVTIIFGGERFSVARIVATVMNTLSLIYGFNVHSVKRETAETTSMPLSRYALPLYKYPPHIGIKNSK